MGRYSLTILAAFFFVVGLVAWYLNPTQQIDWIPMIGLGIAVSSVDQRLREIQKQLKS